MSDYNKSLWDGKMVVEFSNGNKYEGNVKDRKFNGKGKFTYSNGDSYTGQWKNDMEHGYGVFKKEGNFTYEGQWKNGKNTVGSITYQGDFET